MQKRATKTLTPRCSLRRALDILGDAQTLLILGTALSGISRFDDFHRTSGLLKTVLSKRLKTLEQADCLVRRAYSRRPIRHDYLLTEKGRAIASVIYAMIAWDRRWAPNEQQPTVRIVHRRENRDITPRPVCAHCKSEVHASEVVVQSHPERGYMTANYTRRRRQKIMPHHRPGRPPILGPSLELFGDRWASLILRGSLSGLKRFDDFRLDTGISTNILTDRLSRLRETGLLSRRQYSHAPARHEFVPSDKGHAAYPILHMLQQWADLWHNDDQVTPLTAHHSRCDNPLTITLYCPVTKTVIHPEDLVLVITDAHDTQLKTL